MLNKKQFYFSLIIVFIPFLLSAAESQKAYKIDWLSPFENKISPEESFQTLNFKGASYDENFLPNFVFTIPINSYASEIKVRLKNIVTEPLKETELIRHPESIGNDFSISSKVVSKKKKFLGAVSILPIRKSITGGFEKLVSFEAETEPQYVNAKMSMRTYASSSVLATGDWYKIGITQTGVCKIDYNYLKTIGIDVDIIDPRNIKLYGNGGGMLAYANSTPRFDDLQENSIWVSGETDGHFDSGDYVLFYGTNQNPWSYNSTTREFNHQINYYSDTTYYFINVASNPGKRIAVRNSVSGATSTVTSFDDYTFHESELYNFLKSGREWFGEAVDYLNNSVAISTYAPNLITTDTVYFRSNLAGRVTTPGINSFAVSLNNSIITSQNFSYVGPNTTDPYLVQLNIKQPFFSNSQSMNMKFTLNTTDQNGKGWLNYFEMNYRRELNASNSGSQFSFRDKNSVGAGNISEFRISNTTNNYIVWDVTDPMNVMEQQTVNSGGTASFSVNTDQLREFVTFDKQQFQIPIFREKIANQNLHSLAQADMILVTPSLFLQQAYELAEFHRTHDNLSVVVATTQQIFNEYSSGAQDVSAIRDFIKMFYDRATGLNDLPRFVLLFGDASYDNKYRIPGNTNFVTSYESPGSISQTQTYMSDDFFGLLDDTEGSWTGGEILDLSVGRMPIRSIEEAQSAVNKVKHYVSGNNSSTDNPTMGNWRNVVTFIADDQDHNTHLRQADTLAMRVRNAYPLYNIDKIYLDAFNQESTPGGQRYPEAHQAIVDRIQRGTLLTTYIGHGFELGWAHERVLEIADINNWTNYNNMSAFLTATCEFTRVDDPSRTSAGELVFLNPKGGGICLFTTSRLAFSSSNFNLCQKFFTHVFDDSSGEFPTLGEIFERTKVDYFSDPYVRNFLLIGDPAVRLSYPKYSIKTNTINGINISQPIDTLKALSKVTITGEIQDNSGIKTTTFNGTIFPTVFDKTITYYTIGNDINNDDPSTPQAFYLQKNIIFNGKISVINGDFSFTFTVPKDISFKYGRGKLSYYAHNGTTDAAGSDSIVVIGGINNNAVPDNAGPQVQLYINDDKFVRGGLTDSNPVLYATVKDSSGVNMIGTGIGHDMTAELDDTRGQKYILNDYYENDRDSYQSGKVRYPFKNLATGPHTLAFKVWDVYNNSSVATTDFVVSETAELALDHVLNYPNPFTTHTTFMFEHNRPYVPLDVQVQIYTVSGKLIKTISEKITMDGYRSDELQWNGLDDFGDKIGRGVYVYRLRVKTNDGQYADKFEKLVILR